MKLKFDPKGNLEDLARHLISRDATMEVDTADTLAILVRARNELCNDCRRNVAWNMNGSHGFDIHARPCKAIELRALITAILSKQESKLEAFYKAVARLTLNHSELGDHAVVFPSDLGPELEKVDPDWWRHAEDKAADEGS